MKIEKNRKKIITIAMLCLFAAVFCVSVFMLVSQMLERRHSTEAYEELRDRLARPSEMASLEREGRTSGSDHNSSQKSDSDLKSNPASESDSNPKSNLDLESNSDSNQESDPNPGGDSGTDGDSLLLESYAALKEENPDFFGWLSIPDTLIDYPVMHTPSDPEHYIHRAFDGSYAANGVPFLDGDCYEGCGNFIIYGHHMKDGTMFTGLLEYAEQSFWQAHPVLRFDMPEEIAEYEVLAAFYGRIYYVDETDVFRYYRYTDVSDPDMFEEYIAQVQVASLYDTDIDAQPGDQLITLSTCNYHTENGRFVVVARKIVH